eukprot:6337159-Prymnesium_polylepis.1
MSEGRYDAAVDECATNVSSSVTGADCVITDGLCCRVVFCELVISPSVAPSHLPLVPSHTFGIPREFLGVEPRGRLCKRGGGAGRTYTHQSQK